MAFKFVVLSAVLAVANAGLLAAPGALGIPALAGPAISYGAPALAAPISYGAPALAAPAITAQHSNILRTPGNLGQISTYSKSIDTPYSSVRKTDVRVSNDALAYGAIAAPALAAPLAAPALAHPALAAPGLAARAIAPAGLLGVAYSAAPAVAHVSFSGLGASYIL